MEADRGTSSPVVPLTLVCFSATALTVLSALGLVPPPPTPEAATLLRASQVLSGGFASIVGGLGVNTLAKSAGRRLSMVGP